MLARDPPKLERIVGEPAMNAARHTREDGGLAPGSHPARRRRAHRGRGDDGAGVPASCATRSNRSARARRGSHSPGTGIGLSWCCGSPRSTAGAHGWRTARAGRVVPRLPPGGPAGAAGDTQEEPDEGASTCRFADAG